jgi:hypothetical protein
LEVLTRYNAGDQMGQTSRHSRRDLADVVEYLQQLDDVPQPNMSRGRRSARAAPRGLAHIKTIDGGPFQVAEEALSVKACGPPARARGPMGTLRKRPHATTSPAIASIAGMRTSLVSPR